MPRPLNIEKEYNTPNWRKWRFKILMRKTKKLRNGCWIYSGIYLTSFYKDHKQCMTSPHRLAYILLNGHISSNTRIFRKCGNKVCINPKHMAILSELK
jgi:hypothetical protein